MKPSHKTDTVRKRLAVLENLIGLSVDLHNFNAGVQKRHDISVVQWLVLKKIVEQPGLSAGTLAEISGVQPSTLTPTIVRLESMGLIYIQERPTDQRRKLLVASWNGFVRSRTSAAAFAAALSESGDLDEAIEDFENIRSLTKRLLQKFAPASASSLRTQAQVF